MSSLFNAEDDLPLRSRGSGESRSAADPRGEHSRVHKDREFTLNTGTVLGIFLALAILCAVFFGFGYSMGRKSAQPVVSAATLGTDADAPAGSTSGAKPSPGLAAAAQPVPGYVGDTAAVSAETKPKADKPVLAAAPKAESTSVRVPVDDASGDAAPVVREKAQPVLAPKPEPVPAVRVPTPIVIPPVAVASGGALGSTFVQIVAVSHQEDANVVMAALRRRGYNVVQRSTNTDPLIHVQVGPFATRKEAEAMRLRLNGDGYNAILK